MVTASHLGQNLLPRHREGYTFTCQSYRIVTSRSYQVSAAQTLNFKRRL
jgi:hypothetical protein